MKKPKAVVFIDGSNFYFKLKNLKLHNLLEFDFSGFAKKLAGKSKIVDIAYYVGKVKTDGTEKSKQLQADQQKLFAHLKKHSVRYSLGYLMKSDHQYHEIGFSHKPSVALVAQCSHSRLFSKDDLLPFIKRIRRSKA